MTYSRCNAIGHRPGNHRLSSKTPSVRRVWSILARGKQTSEKRLQLS
jgi:hypothetical protein